VEVRRRLYADPETNAALHQVADRYFDPEAMRASTVGPAELRGLEVPALVYWGTANPTPVEAGLRLKGILPRGVWHCAEVGHWAQYERPDEHNRVVLDFLAGA
jgi:pimeloyl-ACP methyl ester carboxylesterase